MTPMPTAEFDGNAGCARWCTASMNRKTAEPPMKAASPSPASGSALPGPNRCSRSAGTKAWRTAIRLRIEAAASSTESSRLESKLTESVSIQASSFTVIMRQATATEAEVARLIKRAVKLSVPTASALTGRGALSASLRQSGDRRSCRAAGTAAHARTLLQPARREIGVRLGILHPLGHSLDPDLAAERFPMQAERRPGCAMQLHGFPALEIRVEHESPGVHALQQDHANRGRAMTRRGRESHGVGIARFLLPGLSEPAVEFLERFLIGTSLHLSPRFSCA